MWWTFWIYQYILYYILLPKHGGTLFFDLYTLVMSRNKTCFITFAIAIKNMVLLRLPSGYAKSYSCIAFAIRIRYPDRREMRKPNRKASMWASCVQHK